MWWWTELRAISNTRLVTLLQCFMMIHLQGEYQIQYARITYSRVFCIAITIAVLCYIVVASRFVETLTLYANIFQTDYKLKFMSYARTNNIWWPIHLYTNTQLINIQNILYCRYPKPGTRNPVATLRVADLADPKNFRIRDIKPPTLLINE